MSYDPQNDLPMKLSDNELSRMVSSPGTELEPYSPPRDFGFDYPEPSSGISLRDICYVIFRHKWKIAFSFLLFSFLSAAFVAIQADVYESAAEILLRGERPNLMVSVDPNTPIQEARAGTVGNVLRAEWTIIEGVSVAEAVVDRVGVEKLLKPASLAMSGGGSNPTSGSLIAKPQKPSMMQRAKGAVQVLKQKVKSVLNLKTRNLTPRQRAVKMVQDNLSIREKRAGSNVLRLTFVAQSPEIAQETLKTLVEEYEKKHIEAQKLPVSQDYFQKRVEELADSLSKKKGELNSNYQKYKITNLEYERERLFGQSSNLELNLRVGKGEAEAYRQRIKTLESILSTRPVDEGTTAVSNSIVSNQDYLNSINQRLIDAELEKSVLLTTHEEDSAAVRQVEYKIKALQDLQRGILASQQNSVVGAVATDTTAQVLEQDLQTTRADLAAKEAQNTSTQEELSSLQKEIENFLAGEKIIMELEQEITQLTAEHEQARHNLSIFSRNDELNRFNVSNVSVTQPATLPSESKKSNRKMLAILVFGMFLGLAGGIGLAFTLDFFNHSLKTNEDVEKWLGLPVLTTLPKVRKHQPESKVIV